MKNIIKRFKIKNSAVVFVSGNFNVVHPGHLRLLRFAKECGTHLVVGVNSDSRAGDAALVPQKDRLECVLAITYVDDAFILDVAPEEVIEELRPKVVVKGKEHESDINPEQKILDDYGGKLLFSAGESFLSSTELLDKSLVEKQSILHKVGENYIARHRIDIPEILTGLEAFASQQVCVLGDLIVDEYVSCEPEGMSREEPVMVVAPSLEKKFLGGAGIVAAHAAGLGGHVKYMGVRGDDVSGTYAETELNGMGVDASLLVDESRPTTVKRRYRVDNKSLLRVNHFRKHPISKRIQNRILEYISDNITKLDLLILADFNYGFLPDEFVDSLIQIAKQGQTMVVADSQSSSQLGNVGRFKGVDLVTPTEHEARVSLHDSNSGLVGLAEKLRQSINARHVLLTLNSEGVLVHAGSDDPWVTDRLPAFCKNPVDPAGAGDCLMVTSALAMSCGMSLWESAYLASMAAGIQVGRLGNIPITAGELRESLEQLN